MTDPKKQRALSQCIQVMREIEGPGAQITVIIRRGPVPPFRPVVERLQDIIGPNGILTTEPEPHAIQAVIDIAAAYKRAIVGAGVMARYGRN